MCRGHFRLLEYPKIEKTCARSLFAEMIPYTGHGHVTGEAYISQFLLPSANIPVEVSSAQAHANQCPGPCQSVPRPVPISAQARANQCPGPCQSVPRPVPISAQASANQCPDPCQSVPRPMPMCLPEEVWLNMTSWLKPRGRWCKPT